jgi:hypothetical protein
VRPRHFFDLDAAIRAVDPPHGVQEHDSDSPERDELETTLGQRVIDATRALTDRANGLGVRPGTYLDFDSIGTVVRNEVRIFIYEGLVFLDVIE